MYIIDSCSTQLLQHATLGQGTFLTGDATIFYGRRARKGTSEIIAIQIELVQHFQIH